MKFHDIKGDLFTTEAIENYQLTDSKMSGGSAIARAGLGALALGPVGLLAGATAKKKYKVLLIFKQGHKLLVTLDEKNLQILIENV